MVYSLASGTYHASGWNPVPLSGKVLLVEGYTGAEGADVDQEKVRDWSETYPTENIGLRLHRGVVGIDVDAYTKGSKEKHGDRTLAEKVEQWGELPATWSSTARGADSPSRIYLYRLPSQYRNERLTANLKPDVEIIQNHHRYVVAWPSVHPDTRTQYTWYTPEGTASPRVPLSTELAELPVSWVKGLMEGASSPAPAKSSYRDGLTLLSYFEQDDRDMCLSIRSFVDNTEDALMDADAGSRHDVMTARVMSLIMQLADGHPGGSEALETFREAWDNATEGEDREDEFERMVTSAAQRAVTTLGATVPNPHNCIADWKNEMESRKEALNTEDTLTVPAQGPELDDWWDGYEPDDDIEYIEEEVKDNAERTDKVTQHVGNEPFKPLDQTDRGIANAATLRVRGFLRLMEGGQWLERGDEKWHEVGDAAPYRVLTDLADFVPATDEHAGLRTKLTKHTTVTSLATMMTKRAEDKNSPLYITADETLGNPYTIWSGGQEIDIRQSRGKLAYRTPDPEVVNLQATRYVADENCPTPVFDELLSAVWPNPEVRRWALRVLSVGVTGLAAPVVPVLYGHGGSGKTSVVQILADVLGDYGIKAESKLIHGDVNLHGTFTYALKGARFAFTDEGPSDAKVSTEALKELTGGSAILANKMRKDVISFRPTHSLIMTTNNEPTLTDPALMRRFRVIPCNAPEDTIKPIMQRLGNYSERLNPDKHFHREAPGILARLIMEAAEYLADPSSADMSAAPGVVQDTVETMRAEQDIVEQWLASQTEETDVQTGEPTPALVLYKSFKMWAMDTACIQERYVMSMTRFGKRLVELHVPKKVTKKYNVYGRKVTKTISTW